MSESYIGRLEKGQQEPSRLAGDALARALGVAGPWLNDGVGEMNAREAVAPYHPSQFRRAVAPSPRSWQAALQPALIGTPLEDKLPWHEISVEDRDTAWRELADDRKREVMHVLRGMASVAEIVYRTLPRQHAEKVLDCLADQMSQYIDAAF